MAAYTTIDDPEAYFQVKIYTGNGSTPSITLDGDTDMQPDLVWIKNRDAADKHCIFDSVRGVTKFLDSAMESGGDEVTDADTLTSFDSDGFALGADDKVNTNTEKYVAWCWKESATSGVDIVSYTGDGNDGRTVSHSLSAVPSIVFCKSRSTTNGWMVNIENITGTDKHGLKLHSSAAVNTTKFHSDEPTSSIFTLSDDASSNEDGETFIAYCFAPKQGFSKFGTVESNGNVDGSFCWLGFRAAFIMIKSVDSTSSWQIFDNKREGYNVDNDALVAEANTAEVTTDYIDILSNGFKVRSTSDPGVAETYIYMAFAEAPFVNSNGVPCNAR